MTLDKLSTARFDWRNGRQRRWLVVVIAVGALLAMAFYAVTDPSAISHDHVLNGADWMGAAICHRLSERSFTVYGRQFPLCARCTGIYLGVFIAFGVLLAAGRSRWGDLPHLPILLTLLALIGVMGVDGLNSYSHFFPNFPHVYEPRNWLRLVTGLGAGLAMGLIVFPALAQTLWRKVERRPSINNFRELFGVGLVALTAVLLILTDQPVLLYLSALASVAGLMFILTAINTVLLLTLFRRDGRALRWRETAVPLFICFIIAIGQLGIITLVRLQAFGTITGFPGL